MALFPHCGLFSYSFDEPRVRVWLGLVRVDGKLSDEYLGMGFKLSCQTSANRRWPPSSSVTVPPQKQKQQHPPATQQQLPVHVLADSAGILREFGVSGFSFPMKLCVEAQRGRRSAESGSGTERTLRASPARGDAPEPGCDIPTPPRTPRPRNSPEEEEIRVALHDGVRVAGKVSEAGEVEAGAGGHLQHAAPRLVA